MILLTCPVWPESTGKQVSVKNPKQEVLNLENHWLQVEDDPNALESVLAPDFLYVVPVGIITKKEQLDFMRKHPSRDQSSKHFEDMHVRVYGNVAIVNGMVVAISGRSIQKTLFTDVFAYREGKWQAVSAQELPVAKTAH
jgi:hypothetical protein